MSLRSCEAAFGALVGSPELSAFGAAPDGDFAAVGARELGRFRSWADYPVARCALGHCDGLGFAHRLHLKRDGNITETLHIYAIL